MIEFNAVQRFSRLRLMQFMVINRTVPGSLSYVVLLSVSDSICVLSDRTLNELDRFNSCSEKNESDRFGSLQDGHSHDR